MQGERVRRTTDKIRGEDRSRKRKGRGGRSRDTCREGMNGMNIGNAAKITNDNGGKSEDKSKGLRRNGKVHADDKGCAN